jgi:glycine betaine/proline transport system substrate-binding protein
MTKIIAFLFAVLVSITTVVQADEFERCKVVRLSDIGWTDVTSTTAVAKELLLALGYEPKVSVLSAPVTFASIKNHDIDVFLGNWMPSQEGDIRHYLNEGSVVQLKQNLEGAVFTLAVPDYVYDAGIRNFADLARSADLFKRSIYGIESGNDGNRLILKMIQDDAFSLKDWRLIESNEQGMLVEVNNAIKQKEFIVFLGWAPHPMNLSIAMKYLEGGDSYFGPNLGAASVFTVARRDFERDCPNLSMLFHNLVFSVPMENELMSLILREHHSPANAAQIWLKKHQKIANAWLDGVVAIDQRSGVAALKEYLRSLDAAGADDQIKAPVGRMMEQAIGFLTTNFADHFRSISRALETIINGVMVPMLKLHWGLMIGFFSVLVYLLRRSLKLVVLVALGLLLIVNLGLWAETVKTLVLVMMAAFVSVSLGVPLGILAARHTWFYSALRPVLDLMQTIPTFVYLIPTLMLFGLGVVPGLISTVVFAIAAPIRLTYAGLVSVPKDLIEASTSFGASAWQTLVKVEIPFAMPSMREGFTQCIMLSLSMVVIAALVGADGLGTPVVRALNTVNIVQGFESGIAIVILAIILDRTLNAREKTA